MSALQNSAVRPLANTPESREVRRANQWLARLQQETLDERERGEQVIVLERVHLYNAGRACGAAVLPRHLIDQECLYPVPSVSRVGAVLREYGLTHGRLGWDDDVEPRWPYDFTKRPKGGVIF